MSLYPTHDKELRKSINEILEHSTRICSKYDCDTCKYFNKTKEIMRCDEPELVDLILAEFERRGYHIGLPESIEWALNSGDGTYKP
jgi:hypothetical protein